MSRQSKQQPQPLLEIFAELSASATATAILDRLEDETVAGGRLSEGLYRAAFSEMGGSPLQVFFQADEGRPDGLNVEGLPSQSPA